VLGMARKARLVTWRQNSHQKARCRSKDRGARLGTESLAKGRPALGQAQALIMADALISRQVTAALERGNAQCRSW